LAGISIYKSEGAITYNKKELRNDPLYMKMLNLQEDSRVKLKGKTLIENANTYAINMKKGDSIICLRKDSLFLYNIHYQ
jgi:hypothetical protein